MTSGHKRTVIYAEDDADDRMFMLDAIGDAGLDCDLRFVENGGELLDYLRSTGKYAGERPSNADVILLDLNMPGVNGHEAMRRIKADPALAHIPIVVLTSSRSEMDIEKSYSFGAASFISKPNSYEGLIEAMKAFRAWWLDHVSYADH